MSELINNNEKRFEDLLALSLGKQQVVWGKADGVFITDIVSPLNLTEFLLPDFDEIRTGGDCYKSKQLPG